MDEMLTPSPPSPSNRGRFILIVALVVAVLLVAYGLIARRAAFAGLQTRSAAAAIVTVSTVHGAAGGAENLVLPGSIQAMNEIGLYARGQGYVRRVYVEIGQKVKAGQLLAEIDTPELDEELRQAEALLATGKANYDLAQSTAERWQQLAQQQLVARQAADEKVADAAAKRAALAGAAANVERLRRVGGFRRIVAPFDGTITARNFDAGQLVTSSGGAEGGDAGARALFQIASNGALRIFVQVPQSAAAGIKAGSPATLMLPERPAEEFPAMVVRTAGAIEPRSRTLLVELSADDAGGALMAGSYAQIRFRVPQSTVPRLPVSTLIFRGQGPMLAVLTPDDTVDLRPIVIGRDYGTEFEVGKGVAATDEVIINPPDSLIQGQQVRRAEPPPVAKTPPTKPAPAVAP